MEFKVTPSEAELLHEMLAHYLHELRIEISRTEHREFRLQLRVREQLLDRLVAELEQAEHSIAGLA